MRVYLSGLFLLFPALSFASTQVDFRGVVSGMYEKSEPSMGVGPGTEFTASMSFDPAPAASQSYEGTDIVEYVCFRPTLLMTAGQVVYTNAGDLRLMTTATTATLDIYLRPSINGQTNELLSHVWMTMGIADANDRLNSLTFDVSGGPSFRLSNINNNPAPNPFPEFIGSVNAYQVRGDHAADMMPYTYQDNSAGAAPYVVDKTERTDFGALSDLQGTALVSGGLGTLAMGALALAMKGGAVV